MMIKYWMMMSTAYPETSLKTKAKPKGNGAYLNNVFGDSVHCKDHSGLRCAARFSASLAISFPDPMLSIVRRYCDVKHLCSE